MVEKPRVILYSTAVFASIFVLYCKPKSSRERISCRFDGGGNNLFEKNLKLVLFFFSFFPEDFVSYLHRVRVENLWVSAGWFRPVKLFKPAHRVMSNFSPNKSHLFLDFITRLFEKFRRRRQERLDTPGRNVVGRRARVFPTRYFSPHDAVVQGGGSETKRAEDCGGTRTDPSDGGGGGRFFLASSDVEIAKRPAGSAVCRRNAPSCGGGRSRRGAPFAFLPRRRGGNAADSTTRRTCDRRPSTAAAARPCRTTPVRPRLSRPHRRPSELYVRGRWRRGITPATARGCSSSNRVRAL